MVWIPQYIRNFVRYSAGHIVTADEYNGDLNLLISQGDNNTEGIEELTEGIEELIEGKMDKTAAEEKIEQAVNEWLIEHPEATTTVQDNSLTTLKYVDGSVTEPKIAEGAVTPSKLDRAYSTPADLASVNANLTNELNVLDARMDEFASLPEGSTSGNAELVDIRVGVDGKTYQSAGDAVRGQVADLKSALDDIYADQFDNTLVDTISVTDEYAYKNYDYNFINGETYVIKYQALVSTGGQRINVYARKNGEIVQTLASPLRSGDTVEVELTSDADEIRAKAYSTGIFEIYNNNGANHKISGIYDSLAYDYSELVFPVNEGKKCWYKGRLYQANTTISTSEAFDISKWDLIKECDISTDNTNKIDTMYDNLLEQTIVVPSDSEYVYQNIPYGFIKNHTYVVSYVADPLNASGAKMNAHARNGGTIIDTIITNMPSGNSVLYTPTQSVDNIRFRVHATGTISVYDTVGVHYESTNLYKRVKKSILDSYGFLYIAYSRISNDVGFINSVEHYINVSKMHFNSVKGDVRITSDGKLIMCHDAGFTIENNVIVAYDSDNNTLIHNMTYAECMALQYSDGSHVCDFDEYISICRRYAKIAFITIRDEYISDILPEMFSTLDKYNYRMMSIVNSFTLESLIAVRALDKDILLSWVQSAGTQMTTAMVDTCLGINSILCMFDFDSHGEFDNIDETVIKYAHDRNIRIFEAIAGKSKVERMIKLGIDGAQLGSLPEWWN